jgi:hypothetical protein
MKTLTVEEVVGRLRAAKDRMEDSAAKVDQITDKAGRLLLAEEDWIAKHKHRFQSGSSKEGGGGGGQSKGKPRSDAGGSSGSAGIKLTSEGTPRRKGRCRNCGIYGHWAQDCKRPKRERKEEKKEAANVAVADTEQPMLFMAAASGSAVREPRAFVHLAEKNVVPMICDDDTWVLDTGASNHMTGTRSALSYLDDGVRGSVRFGDGSCVEIRGIGSVVIEGRQHEHKVLSDVYYIPKLKSNIVSLGQLEEGGCDVRLKDGFLKVFDRECKLLISAPRTANRLYTIKFAVVPPVCFLSSVSEKAWQWHARFGHLNFRALRDLGRKKMVSGMPMVDHVEQVCDSCTLGKQHRAPFPQSSTFRAEKALDLFHADLCGQITPPTVGGCSYFLLVVDDYSRYMWVEILKTKDQALAYLKKVKERAEVDQGGRLKALRTDRGESLTPICSQCFAMMLASSIIQQPLTPLSRMGLLSVEIKLWLRWLDA